MKDRITETVELVISYCTNGTGERIDLRDLHDALTECARSILPPGATPISWTMRLKAIQVSDA